MSRPMTKDQINLEGFLGHVLDDYKVGTITRQQAVGGLVHLAVALNKGDFDEARRWSEQGRKLVRDLISVDEALMLLTRPPAASDH